MRTTSARRAGTAARAARARRTWIAYAIAALAWSAAEPAAAQSRRDEAWIELSTPRFVVLTDTDEEKGRRILEDFEARYAAYESAIVPVRSRQFPIRVFLFDELQDFQSFLPEAVTTRLNLRNERVPERSGYLFRGDIGAFIVLRDRGVDDLADDVGHSVGHLLLAQSLLWQPFWLQEAVGEFVRALGRGGGGDPVDAGEAFPLDELVEIVPSEDFDDLGDGGTFRRQSYHLFRVLLEDYPRILADYVAELGFARGYDAALNLDAAAFGSVASRVLEYDDRGLGLAPAVVDIVVRTIDNAALDAAKGDLAAAAGLQNLARNHYQASRTDAARIGMARLSMRDARNENTRSGLRQLAAELPESGLAQYAFGSLPTSGGEDRLRRIDAMERAIELLPYMGRAYAGLGALYVEEGRPEDAIRLAEEAIDLEPEFADRAFEVIMEARLAAGDTDGAIQAAETAATLPHSDPGSLDHYRLLVPELYRRLERIRREEDANRLDALRRELETRVEAQDPRPTAAPGGPVPLGLVHYDTSSDPPPGVSEPRLVSGDLPAYSTDMRRDRIQGRVVLDVDLDRQGRVTSAQVRSADDPALSAAATAALRRWRFDPARLREESVAFSFRLTFTFDLQE